MTSDSADRRKQRRRNAIIALQIGGRGVASATALLAVYYLLPVRAKSSAQQVLWLVLALALFVAVVGFQVRAIVNSRHPRLRAIASMTVIIPLFLIVFARIYLTISSTNAHSFGMNLDRTQALYFTITVFATVGFGDISPKTDFTRIVVSVQMLLDLVVLGVLVRALLGAAERGTARRASEEHEHGADADE